MSLPDSAEYWWDIKSRKPHTGKDYYHVPGFPCGHRHLFEAKYIDEVNCRACKKAIEAGLEHNLKSAEQHKSDKESQARNDLANRKRKSIKNHPNSPICNCGFAMLERKNGLTGEHFYGCSDYPNCKNTKPIS